MRTLALPLLVAACACSASAPDDPIFIDDFISRSHAIHCDPVPSLNTRNNPIRAVVPTSDTSFLVLYDQDREVALVGPDLRFRHLIAFTEDGPTGVKLPSSVALLGDSLLYIADKASMRLKKLDLQGRDRGTVQLDFAPQHLQSAGNRILITPLVIGSHPRTLLYSLDDDRAHSLAIPTANYRDGLVHTLANTTHIAAFPDGRVVLTHFMMIPFARVLTPTTNAPASTPLPLPDGVRKRYGWIPNSNVTEADVDRLLFPVIASAPDPTTGDLIYLTKTGRTTDTGSEKALIRVDRELRYLRSYLLDVNVTFLVYLPGQELSLVTDEEAAWYSCHTP